jgi:hypothetical protein
MEIHLLRFPEDMRGYRNRIDLASESYKLESEFLNVRSEADEINLESLDLQSKVDRYREALKALAPIGTTKIIDDPDDEPSSPDNPGVWNIRAIGFSPETQPVDIKNIFSIGIIEEWRLSHGYEIGFLIYPKIGTHIAYVTKIMEPNPNTFDGEFKRSKLRLRKFVEAERDRLIQAWTNQKE